MFQFAYLLTALVHYPTVPLDRGFGPPNSFAIALLQWMLKYPHSTPVSVVIHKLGRRRMRVCPQRTRVTRLYASFQTMIRVG